MTPANAKARAERAVHDVWFAAMCLARDHDPEDIEPKERGDLLHAIDVLQRVIAAAREAA